MSQATRILKAAIAGLQNWWRRKMHASLILGAILIAVAWTAVRTQIEFKNEELRNEALTDVSNFTLLFQQDALRTARELDRIILYLRRSYERLGYHADWPSLISEQFTASSHTVQIAIMNAKGMMITSSAMLYPKSPIDLSDREHFKVHARGGADELFISKPVVGRASGQWSIQFTRRFHNQDGSFGGVIVVSLNPSALVGTYTRIQALANAAFTLVGKDDVVRAGEGSLGGVLGQSYREGTDYLPIRNRIQSLTAWEERRDGVPRIAASMPVGDLPLTVIVAIDNPARSPLRAREVAATYAIVSLFSLIILVASAFSVRRERSMVRQITQLAHNDTLTGLANRLEFRKRLDRLYAPTSPHRGSALHLIDLDRFKAVNDGHGHPVGDKLLVAVAERLRANVRKNDIVFRLGGDEFAILQMDCPEQDQAGIVAARICAAMAEPFVIDGNRLEIGSSIGVALAGVDADSATSLLQAADLALYLAKSDGRSTYRYFNAEMNAQLHRRRQTELELAGAAGRGELELHYQPKVGPGGICGYEALLRWRHPVRGQMSPAEFIPLAEETGLIVPIGEWTLLEACTCMAARAGEQTVAVNVSPVQLARGNLVATVERALAASGLPPHRLEIEITETVLMSGGKPIISQLQELRRLGIRIALDDFGTGYSSLSYLHTYPIDCIKIDRSFVRTIGEKADASPIIRAIITMARELDMSTVAEGVETEAQVDALLEQGCTLFQGFHFGKPRPAADIWPAPREGEEAGQRPIAA